MDYAAAHDTPFPAADPASYTMGWCDCYWDVHWHGDMHPCHAYSGYTCGLQQCGTAGFYAVGADTYGVNQNTPEFSVDSLYCCRPCFQVAQ